MNLNKIKNDAYLNIETIENKAQEMKDDSMEYIRKNLTIYQPLSLAVTIGCGLVSLYQENLPLTAFSFLSAIGAGYLIHKSVQQVKENLGDIDKRK